MSQKLSFAAIAATLATLGATGVAGCATSQPAASPVGAKEVPAAAAPDDGSAQASCGATDKPASCGAGDKQASCGASGQASCGAAADDPATPDGAGEKNDAESPKTTEPGAAAVQAPAPSSKPDQPKQARPKRRATSHTRAH
ncbi:MAG: hypothetical protein OZ921_18635, partial [Sorangiineae bacterium]|nr:hypothetical protein [Sorangiineae bacterium]